MSNILNYTNSSLSDILIRTKELVNKKISDFLPENTPFNKRDKGEIGNFIQEYWFGIKRNSDNNPDFNKEEIELKAVPLLSYKNQKKSSKYRIKERTKICSINYLKIINEKWDSSHAKRKLNKILFVFVLWDESNPPNSTIIDYHYYELEKYKLDKEIIKQDWEIINNLINEQKSQLISETLFHYLSASTSGSGKLLPVPYTDLKIKERSFSLKPSYTKVLFDERIGIKYSSIESIYEITSFNQLKSFITEKLSKLNGLTISEIENRYNSKKRISLNKYSLLVKELLGLDKKKEIKEFKKFNINIKVIRVHPKTLLPHQAISFPHQTLQSILDEDSYENSELAENLNLIMFVILKSEYSKADKPELVTFDRVFFWKPNELEISGIIKEYNSYKKVIQDGVIVTKKTVKSKKGYVFINNLIGSKNTKYIHLRPHGSDNSDVDTSLGYVQIPKQCFWLNKGFIQKIISSQIQ
jgi:DNA mismatch repair protein MutH